MTSERRNNLFYVAALIDYVARETKNHRRVIVSCIGVDGMRKLLRDAPVNHCLSFEQVVEETIDAYSIPHGDYDAISTCEYSIPSYVDIGKIYAYLTEDINDKEALNAQTLFNLFSSFLADAISDFRTGIYFENLSYLLGSYRTGKHLDVA